MGVCLMDCKVFEFLVPGSLRRDFEKICALIHGGDGALRTDALRKRDAGLTRP